MSDDILSVATPFPDVASLAQGYINRVDGERLLLPLEVACDEGAGVRFVIYLGDGTAAFAGAGRCVQVSDQGTNVPPNARYETLIDSLDLDERSRPVYDYIVAVRAAAYGQGEGEGEGEYADADAEAHEDVADAAIEVEADADAASLEVEVASERPAQLEPVDEEVESLGYEAAEPSSFEEVAGDVAEPVAEAYASVSPEPESLEVPDQPPSVRPGEIPTAALDSFRPEVASFIPPPIPTGILQRPARALHWQPAPPRRPTPLPQTGLFRYSGPGLPKPSTAPHPDLDPSQWVQRAPRPV